VLKPEKQDYSVNTTRPFTLWPDGTPAPQLLELQQERMTERNEQCESLNLLPDPCAGTRGARSDVWKVSRNEKILETVVDSENIDLFLSIIAKSLKIPVVYLPRLTLTIQGEHVDISNYGLGEFQRQAKLINPSSQKVPMWQPRRRRHSAGRVSAPVISNQKAGAARQGAGGGYEGLFRRL
jgi:hypothetical protein